MEPNQMLDLDPDNDDQLVGRILSRREVLTLFGAAGALWLTGCTAARSDNATATATATATSGNAATSTHTPMAAASTPTSATSATSATTSAAIAASTTSTATASASTSAGAIPACVVSPALTEGPYFVDEKLNRSDIRSDPATGKLREGVPLRLALRVSRMGSDGCVALAGATVDIWHCDAQGVYSDVNDPGFSTVGQQFLRGYQVTDAGGVASFTTIYPGWYQGRAVHIHFKVRGVTAAGQSFEFTSQLFFTDAQSDEVFARSPYASKGQRTLLNAGDGIYRAGGDQLLLALTPAAEGYTTTFDIGMQFA